MNIREVTGSPEDLVAFGAADGIVTVWNAEGQLTKIDAGFQPGGNRLCVDVDTGSIFVGNYDSNKISCFSIEGELIWSKKLMKPGDFAVCNSGFYVSSDGKNVHLLSLQNGEDLQVIKKCQRAFASRMSEKILVEEKETFSFYSNDGTQKLSDDITKSSTAILSVAFHGESVLVSEMRSGLRAFNLSDYMEQWGCSPDKGSHFLRIIYSDEVSSFIGGVWSYIDGGGATLYHIAEERLSEIGQLGSIAFCFFNKGNNTVNHLGQIMNVSDCSKVGQFAV